MSANDTTSDIMSKSSCITAPPVTPATSAKRRDWGELDILVCRARNSLFTALSFGNYSAAITEARALAALAVEMERAAIAGEAARAARIAARASE